MFIRVKPRGFCGPFQGWRVVCLGGGGGAFGASAPLASSFTAAASAWVRALRTLASSLSRQQFLYFFPEPQWQGSLRPGVRAGSGTMTSVPPYSTTSAPVDGSSGGGVSSAPMPEPKVGDKAPDFALKSTSGETVSLGQFKGTKNVLVAFFPLAFTGVCTAENCAISEDYSKFESRDTAVLPVSVDSTPTHNEFRAKHGMKHHILSDFKREASRAYGVLDEEKFFSRRAYFLVDKNGVVRWKHVEAELGHSRPNAELLAEIQKVAG
jgi:mycoredoxin-dependent peroxiredoxin